MIGTDSFDKTGPFTMTDQGYVSAAHEDMELPTIAAEGTGGNGKAIMAVHVERQRRADRVPTAAASTQAPPTAG